MKTYYTVLLLYPDYITDNFGQETYMCFVKTLSPKCAVELAQNKAAKHNSAYFGKDDTNDPFDFHPLLTIKGKHKDLTP